jgi:hypothetical protein
MGEQSDCTQVRLMYLTLKSKFIDNVGLDDQKIDESTKHQFYSNNKLFSPLNNHSPLSFESGGMSSYIRL